VPARIIPESKKAFYEENGEEKTTDRILYLLHEEGFSWLKSSDGETISDAVLVGDGYIGRANVEGTTVIGKVDLNTKQLIASYYGKIINLVNYDVLVFNPSSE
jgi:hypothetical protein